MPCSIDNGGVCCWVDKGDFGNGSASCAPNASACSDPILIATDIACQLPSQCPGQICCAHRASQNVNVYGYTACQDDCPYPDRYLCDINNPDCPTYTDQNGNPIQSFCKPSTLLPPGYYVCGFN
jgi:hypothetical protein